MQEQNRGSALANANRVVIIGGGAAGLAAAYTLQKRGVTPILLEGSDHVGGRLAGDSVDGFSLDTGSDFFSSSYDVTFRICREFGLPLIQSKMKLGWYRNGRWVTTTPGLSPLNLSRNLRAAAALGFLSPRALWPVQKLFGQIFRQSKGLSFASDSRIAEIDEDESFGEYLDRLGIPPDLQVSFRGFLEMTMGHVEYASAPYMRTYLAEMLVRADKIYVPEQGSHALSTALANACFDTIHVATPVTQVNVDAQGVTGVAVDSGVIEADAVICAVPATKVSEIIPTLPREVHEVLKSVTYSSGCRVVIGLDRPPLPTGWNAALYPEDNTPLLLDRSVNLPSCAPPGKSTLDMLVGRDRAKKLIPLGDEEIKRAMLADARNHPPPSSRLSADDEGIFTRVYRWEEAVCMAPPGMFRAMEDTRQRLNRDMKNLFLAGDYMGVPSVNGALASGVRAAEEAANLLSQRLPLE